MPFLDRCDAGRRLAKRLDHLRGEDVVVLGLPRGGVPVAFEVARALGAPLDVIVVRKLGVPFQPEVAMGAVGEDGAIVLNPDVLRVARIGEGELRRIEENERAEVSSRVHRFRAGRERTPVRGRTAVIVDDGIATGATAAAACQIARAQGARRVVLAVPVASPSAVAELSSVADEVVCAETPYSFRAVGEWYEDFTQTTDQEVIALLTQAGGAQADAAPGGAEAHRTGFDEEITIAAGTVMLPGRLTLPVGAPGLVVFVHGSGSSRHSPRNQYVARLLNDAGLGTLLFDLLSPLEEKDRSNVFDIELLAHRLRDTIDWLRDFPVAVGLPIGLFGASTGAGAALWAAAEPDVDIAAVVSRGGRPDLAAARLTQVRAPTLLIVGELDGAVVRLNQAAKSLLRCENRLVLVRGATHLFEEPGTLQIAAELARNWFQTHLSEQKPTNRE